jgi:outer membrane lipopolysaccharide assembly protein LptE/RlpB
MHCKKTAADANHDRTQNNFFNMSLNPYKKFLSIRPGMAILHVLQRMQHPLLLLMALWPMACGYHFAGDGELPGNIRTLSVTMLDNRTSETGLESTLTNALIYEMGRSGRIQLVAPDQAEATLSGEITRLTIETISHRGEHTSNERRVTVYLDLQLRTQNGEMLWEQSGLSEKEAYNVLEGKLETEQKRRKALQTLARRLSETVFNRLTDNF